MFTVDQFVDDCLATLSERSPTTAMNDLLLRTISDPSSIDAALGVPTQGGINTLYRSTELTVLQVIWAPEMRLYPHDHQMWAVIGVYGGEEQNAFYRRTEHGLEQAGGKLLQDKSSVILGEHVIHAVNNPRTRFTGAIHVYGGDFFAAERHEWDPETLEERPFSLERARQAFADANAAWAAKESAAR